MRLFMVIGLALILVGCQDPAEEKLAEAIRWYTGEAGMVDDEKAQGLLYDAANLGGPLPEMWIVRCYSTGRMGFEKDYERAVARARSVINTIRYLAEEEGNREAVFLMGSAYAEGLGVSVDEVEAVNWYRKAAEAGHTLAEHNLGNVYFAGRGVPQNDSLAVVWWRRAAVKGDAITQLRLGEMYEQGKGVELDRVEALAWYREAAQRGNAQAREAVARMESE